MIERPDPGDDVAMLLAFVRDRDASCPLCGYNLRGLTRPVCPECKQDLALAVGASKVRLGWFVATIAPGVFSGFAGTFLLTMIIIAHVFGQGGPPALVWLVDIFGLTSGLVTLGIILGRNQFLARPASQQRRWAIGAWAIHIGALAAVLMATFYV